MRTPRSNSGDGDGAVINLSPMLDVLFILIIFFLATATFKQQEYDEKINLPQTNESKTISDAPKVLVVNVRETGKYVLADRVMNLDQLRKRVAQAVEENRQQKVLIRGDRKALHQHVASAVRACRKAGVTKANIGYDSNP